MSEEKKYNHLEAFYDLYYYLKNNESIYGIDWNRFIVNILLDDAETIISIKVIPDSVFNAQTRILTIVTVNIDNDTTLPDEVHDNQKSVIKYIRKIEKKINIVKCPTCQTKFKP